MTTIGASTLNDYSLANVTTASQQAAAANSGRNYLLIQNTSDVTISVAFNKAATNTPTAGNGSLQLVAGAVHEWLGNQFIPTGTINVIAASGASKTVVIWEV